MQISVAGTRLTTRCDWTICTCLRDNVQQHLESGLPSGRFPNLHALADRCWSHGPVSLPAAALQAELEAVWLVLEKLPVEKFAIGIRSRAALTGAQVAPSVRGTVLLRLTGWKAPIRLAGSRTLGDVFHGVHRQLLDFCRSAGPSAQLDIGAPERGSQARSGTV
jgi:hypothetical protein